MSEVPQTEPERSAYAAKVMAGVKWQGDRALNLEQKVGVDISWSKCTLPMWNWDDSDYRLIEPEQVMWANGYPQVNSLHFYEAKKTIDTCAGPDRTHYIKRTTGGGRALPEYEAVELEE